MNFNLMQGIYKRTGHHEQNDGRNIYLLQSKKPPRLQKRKTYAAAAKDNK